MNLNENTSENVTIIGSGPAGWTAAIYTARANLNPVVYEGKPRQDPDLILPGGQLMLTTEVENYPGYPDGVDGPKMMEDFKKQAQRFDTRVVSDDIVNCDFSSRPFTLTTGAGDTIRSHAVIIATGATANWLGLENEQRLARSGGGVSACAVCDGALPVFRDQPLAVVGGGDTAMEDASYLTKFASRVYIIHRRDQLRASKVMQQRILDHPKAQIIWNSQVIDVLGDDRVEAIKLINHKTSQQSTLDVKGLFVAIGHTPATGFLQNTSLKFDAKKYLLLDDPGRTSTHIQGVFAAGDVADPVYRQAVTAAGMGCKAAIDAEHWLTENGLLNHAPSRTSSAN